MWFRTHNESGEYLIDKVWLVGMISLSATKGKSKFSPGPREKSSIGWKRMGKDEPNMVPEPPRRNEVTVAGSAR